LVCAGEKKKEDRKGKEIPESFLHLLLPDAVIAVSPKTARFSVYEIANEKSRLFGLEAVRF
jgi:hypothetical protein